MSAPAFATDNPPASGDRASPVLHAACLCAVISAMLSACAVGPDFVRPAAPDVTQYTTDQVIETVAADGQTQRFSSGAAMAANWWRLFNSTQLDAMLEQAVANNATLQAAEARLRQSQDILRAGHGVFFPQIGAQLGASRERNAPAQQGLQTQGTIFNLVTLSGTINYALDVFGGERRAIEGMQAQSDYQRHQSQAAFLALSANVVNTAIARAGYGAQLRATRELIALEDQQLQAIEVQVRAGTSPYANVLSQRGLIARNEATLAPLEQKFDQSAHLLATLQGVLPSTASLPDIDLSALTLPLDLPLSLPSDLVRQRPDILSAEAQMHAASADIGVATAAMFPSFKLSGSYGAVGSSIATMSKGSDKFWNIGPSVAIPIFSGGSSWFGRRAAIDAHQAAQATYRQTVVSAFAQVADALTALEHDAQALQAQVDAQRAAAEALQQLQANYRAGLVSYVDVLTADVQFHDASIACLQAVALRLQDTVALFVALGGGWWNQLNSSGDGAGEEKTR